MCADKGGPTSDLKNKKRALPDGGESDGVGRSKRGWVGFTSPISHYATSISR